MLASNESYYFVNEMRTNLINNLRNSTDGGGDSISDEHHRLEDDNYRPRQRRRQPPESKKVCRVCGDKAFSVNFNVVTCESCKAFFRRNALKTKELRCQTSGNCEINLQTRRSCKKCRLRKCFEVGMIKEWIMSDEARQRKRQLIERNREKRQRLVALNKSGNSSDDEAGPQSLESEGVATDYKPLMCTVPTATNGMDYSPLDHWQSPPASVFFQQPSPSSSSFLYPYASTSAFQTPTILASPNPPAHTHTLLPIEPAVPSTPIASHILPPPPLEEMIRIPKTLLAALIDQCHTGTTCCHQDANNQGRPSVIVSNKSTPLKCICHCRCGAKISCSSIVDEPAEKVTEVCENHIDFDSDSDSDSDSDMDETFSIGSMSDLALVSPKKPDHKYILKFNFGLSEAKIFHLENLFSAFKYPHVGCGRIKDDPKALPLLPPLDRYRGDVAACANRMDVMVRRLIKFCTNVAATSNLKKKSLVKLVKACCQELVLLHSVLAYVPEQDAWYDQGPNVRPIDASELKTVHGGVHENHIGFIRTFPGACKNDAAIVITLCAMALFNPMRVEEKEKEHVQLMRTFYLGLLSQYLESRFDKDKAHRLRGNLLSHFEQCSHVASRVTPTVVVELNERDLEPMLIDTLGYVFP